MSLPLGPGAVLRARRTGAMRDAWTLRMSFTPLRAEYVLRKRLARRRRTPGPYGARFAPGEPGEPVRAVYLIPAAPGDAGRLTEVIESIRFYEGAEARVLVLDDYTHDCDAAAVQARWPDVDVVRPPRPLPGVHRQYEHIAFGVRTALEHHAFEVLVRLDTDALITGPGLARRAAERFAAEPRVGQLGTCRVHAAGHPRDVFYERWSWTASARWSPRARRLLRAVEARGRDALETAHGGVYVLSRAAVEALRDSGALDWRPPPGWLLFEDFTMSAHLQAAGFEIGSWGGPGEPIASTSDRLPLPLERLAAEGRLAVHPTKRGHDGEPEEAVHAFFRARRVSA